MQLTAAWASSSDVPANLIHPNLPCQLQDNHVVIKELTEGRDLIFKRILGDGEAYQACKNEYASYAAGEGEFGKADTFKAAEGMPAWKWWLSVGGSLPMLQVRAAWACIAVRTLCIAASARRCHVPHAIEHAAAGLTLRQ